MTEFVCNSNNIGPFFVEYSSPSGKRTVECKNAEEVNALIQASSDYNDSHPDEVMEMLTEFRKTANDEYDGVTEYYMARFG
jgi:hypothetical protein